MSDEPLPPWVRNRVEVDFEKLDKLCGLQCTEQEIADFFGISVSTLALRIAEKTGGTFKDYYKKHSAGGKVSLRRHQWDLAKKGNATMQIWLGKQWLGQRETNYDINVNTASEKLVINFGDEGKNEGEKEPSSGAV